MSGRSTERVHLKPGILGSAGRGHSFTKDRPRTILFFLRFLCFLRLEFGERGARGETGVDGGIFPVHVELRSIFAAIAALIVGFAVGLLATLAVGPANAELCGACLRA